MQDDTKERDEKSEAPPLAIPHKHARKARPFKLRPNSEFSGPPPRQRLIAAPVAAVLWAASAIWWSIASLNLANTDLTPPTLDGYLAHLAGQPTPQQSTLYAPTLSVAEAIPYSSLVGRVFNSIRQFENGRAERLLTARQAVISGVTQGSPSQTAGIQGGDIIIEAAGKPISSALDFLAALSQNLAPAMELKFQRDKQVFTRVLISADGLQLNLQNSGLIINLPDGVRYLSADEATALAEEFIKNYVENIPADWRRIYAANLNRLMQDIANSSQAPNPSSKKLPALSSEQALVWHHESFISAVEQLNSDLRQTTRIAALAQAVCGLTTALFAITALITLVRPRQAPKGNDKLRRSSLTREEK